MGQRVVFDVVGECCRKTKAGMHYKWAKVIVAKPKIWFCGCARPRLIVNRRLVEERTLIGFKRGRDNEV